MLMCSVGPVTVAFAGSMPMNEKANTVPFFTPLSSKRPSASVVTPIWLPSTMTVTPARGSPDSRVTTP